MLNVMSNPAAPTHNAFGQPIRPPSPADKRRAAAWAPFLTQAPKSTAKPTK